MKAILHEAELVALRSHHERRLGGCVAQHEWEPALARIAALTLAIRFPQSQLRTILHLSKRHGRAVRRIAERLRYWEASA